MYINTLSQDFMNLVSKGTNYGKLNKSKF